VDTKQDRPRILIVDDEPSVLQICTRALSKSGYVVQEAEDAEQARRYLEQGRFDLVILDIHLPNEDGISLLKHIHRLDPSLPAILMTGYPAMETVMDSVRLGASEYLCKPFTMDSLLDAVASGLEEK
jgi:DNA-binding NtrC family response regulator